MAVSWLLILGLVLLGIVALVFGSITLWVWMGTKSSHAESTETARLARLEAEVAELRDLVTDAILNEDDRAAARLAGERSTKAELDA